MTTALTPLENLPNEILQRIGFLIDDDRDLVRFIRTSRPISHALHGESSPVWRQSFLELYDRPPWLQGEDARSRVMEAYQWRSVLFRTSASFCDPPSPESVDWLLYIKYLVNESYPAPLPGRPLVPSGSKNLRVLHDVLWANRFFDRPTYRHRQDRIGISKPDYDALQLLFTPFALELESHGINANKGRLDYDIANVYPAEGGFNVLLKCPVKVVEMGSVTISHPLSISPQAAPHQRTDSLDLFILLQIRNFWKRHLTGPQEETCHRLFKALPGPRLPFDEPLRSGFKPLGRRWEGLWANPGPDFSPAEAEDGDQMWADEIAQMGSPPYMWIDLAFSPSEDHWIIHTVKSFPADTFEGALPHRVFTGHGRDIYSRFAVVGIVSPMLGSGGIPGWQHIWMLKHYVHPHGIVKLFGEDAEAARDLEERPGEDTPQWLFEGIVLPGGKVVMGLWENNFESLAGPGGPFIMWCVEEDPEWIEKSNRVKRRAGAGDEVEGDE